MGRGNGGGGDARGRQAEQPTTDKLDIQHRKAARHWLKKPLPPRDAAAGGSRPRQRRHWPVKPAEPWWPGGTLDTVQQSEGILPSVGWLCVLPREERVPLSSPSSSSSQRLVQTMRPYKCGPAPVFHSTGVKATHPRRSMVASKLPPLAPRLDPPLRPAPPKKPPAPKAAAAKAPAAPLAVPEEKPTSRRNSGHVSDEEPMIEESPLGQLREAFRKMSSMNSVVTSIKSNPNPLLERRRSSLEKGSTKTDENPGEQEGPKDGAKMLLRMMNLEVKTRQSHRREKLLRGVFDAMTCQVQLAKRARKTFTEEEAKVVHAAFLRCAGQNQELSSENALFSCLVDLGLTGTSVAEKQEVWRQIAVAFGNPPPSFEDEVDEATMRECDKLQALVRRQGDGVCEQELILYVMPAIRLALQELVEDEMDQRLHRLDGDDRDVTAVPVKLCARVARLMGVDTRLFMKTIQEIVHAEGHTRSEIVSISLEQAARAVVSCRERVARKLRSKELPLKQELCMTEAKIISSRPHLLELHMRFWEQLAMDGDRKDEAVLNEDAVYRMLKEMGLLPSDGQGPDLGEFLYLDILEIGRRFSFARLQRVVEMHRQDRMQFKQEELETAFAHARRGAPALTPAAAAQALSQLHLNPVRREDQNDITNILAEAVGVNRHGALNFQSFQALCMRVQDRLSLLRYEAGFECGVVVGLSEMQVMNLWEAFHALEPPQEGLFKGFTRTTSYAKGDDEWEGLDSEEEPSKALVALEIATMPTMANGFMTYISANAPRPLVQVTNGRFLCARLAERWTTGNLKKALRLLRLPSEYVQSLDDDELAPVLADHFGLPPEATTCRSIGEALCVGTPEELHRKAQAIGFAHAQLLGWEAVRAESSSVKLNKLAENV